MSVEFTQWSACLHNRFSTIMVGPFFVAICFHPCVRQEESKLSPHFFKVMTYCQSNLSFYLQKNGLNSSSSSSTLSPQRVVEIIKVSYQELKQNLQKNVAMEILKEFGCTCAGIIFDNKNNFLYVFELGNPNTFIIQNKRVVFCSDEKEKNPLLRCLGLLNKESHVGECKNEPFVSVFSLKSADITHVSLLSSQSYHIETLLKQILQQEDISAAKQELSRNHLFGEVDVMLLSIKPSSLS